MMSTEKYSLPKSKLELLMEDLETLDITSPEYPLPKIGATH